MHPATAAHAKFLRAWCMGGSGSQCVLSSTVNASHDDMGAPIHPSFVHLPRTAKRPSLITHPRQSSRTVDMTGSSVQVHAASCAPCPGGPQISTDDSPKLPPAQTMRPSGSRAAAGHIRPRRRLDCGVHTPVARSTSCTVDSGWFEESTPPRRSTCPAALSLSSTAIAAAPQIPPHDSGGRLTNAAPSREGSTSTFAVAVKWALSSERPPTTATELPTAQQALSIRAVTSAGINSHCSVARSSLHTSLAVLVAISISSYTTTSPARVLRCPLSRRPAHPCQPPRPDGPGEHGDVRPDLRE